MMDRVFFRHKVCGFRVLDPQRTGRPKRNYMLIGGTGSGVENNLQKALNRLFRLRDTSALSDYPALLTSLYAARSQEDSISTLMKAAETVGRYGSSDLTEPVLCALLLSETPGSDYRQVLKNLGEAGGQIHKMVIALRKARRLPFSIIALDNPAAVVDYHELIKRTLVDSWGGNRDLLLAHLAYGLAGLEERESSEFDLRDRLHYYAGLAPLAERFGFLEVAERIRSKGLRDFKGLRFFEHIDSKRIPDFRNEENALNHLDNLRDLLEDAFDEIGLNGKVGIKPRLKGKYSIYEKLQASGIDPEDSLGIEITVEDLSNLWKVVQFLKQYFKFPSRERHRELFELLDKGRIQLEDNNIDHPRKSGFSAYTLLVEDHTRVMVEIQVTTFDRDRVNREGIAAHWAYKLKRTLEVLGVDYEQDLKASGPAPDEVIILILDRMLPCIIRRFKVGTRVSDLAQALGSPVTLFRPLLVPMGAPYFPQSVSFTPKKIKPHARLRDGMVFSIDLRSLSPSP